MIKVNGIRGITTEIPILHMVFIEKEQLLILNKDFNDCPNCSENFTVFL